MEYIKSNEYRNELNKLRQKLNSDNNVITYYFIKRNDNRILLVKDIVEDGLCQKRRLLL